MKQHIRVLLACGVLLIGTACASDTNSNEEKVETSADYCAANPQWAKAPNPPGEIPGGGSDLCQFYQFSWQWFISLMSRPGGGERVFHDAGEYAAFLGTESSSCASNDSNSDGVRLFVRARKDGTTTSADFTLPEDMNQALGKAVIYDQQGNVVLYEARFSRAMCALPAKSPTLPAGTTEMKVSWRIISEAEKPDYVWINSDVNSNGKIEQSELFGMVGFHLVKSTPEHPEFIWASFEHRSNTPDCQSAVQLAPADGWSFTSAECAGQLPSVPADSSCSFNVALEPKNPDGSPLAGTPTEICRVYAQSTAPADNQAETNRSNIVTINMAMKAIFEGLSQTDPLSVLANYRTVGALWESNVSLASTDRANQRGSIQLANTTMETNAQQGFASPPYTSPKNLQPAANCFDCHSYSDRASNASISHIFANIHGAAAAK